MSILENKLRGLGEKEVFLQTLQKGAVKLGVPPLNSAFSINL